MVVMRKEVVVEGKEGKDGKDVQFDDVVGRMSPPTRPLVVSQVRVPVHHPVEAYHDKDDEGDRFVDAELFSAIAEADVELAREALMIGAAPEADGFPRFGLVPPLHLACRIGESEAHVDIVSMLLSAGASAKRERLHMRELESSYPAPMFYALGIFDVQPRKAHAKIVKVLLEQGGVDPNAGSLAAPAMRMYDTSDPEKLSPPEDHVGRFAPLHFAAMLGFREAVDLLLDYGADPNVLVTGEGTFSNLTPLHLVLHGAGELQRVAILESILRAGGDPALRDNDGRNGLHLAAMKGCPHSTRALLNVSLALLVDEEGTRSEALQRAPELPVPARGEVAQYAAELFGAKDNQGWTAWDYARVRPVFVDVLGVLVEFAELAGVEVPANVRSLPSSELSPSVRQEWNAAPRGGWEWNDATPLDSDRCDVDRVPYSELTPDEFQQKYYLPSRPVILTGNMTESWRAWRLWTKDAMLDKFGHWELAGGPIPHAKAYGRNEESKFRLDKFISSTMRKVAAPELEHAASDALLETTDHAPSRWTTEEWEQSAAYFEQEGDPWILFDGEIEQHYPEFRKHFSMPEHFGRHETFRAQLSLGSFGAGAPFHHHVDAMSSLVYGKKLWRLVPPALQHRLHGEDGASNTGLFETAMSSLAWTRTKLPLVQAHTVVQCTQGPGEVLYVPRLWAHSTINLSETVNVAVEFLNFDGVEVELAPYLTYRQSVVAGKALSG